MTCVHNLGGGGGGVGGRRERDKSERRSRRDRGRVRVGGIEGGRGTRVKEEWEGSREGEGRESGRD